MWRNELPVLLFLIVGIPILVALFMCLLSYFL